MGYLRRTKEASFIILQSRNWSGANYCQQASKQRLRCKAESRKQRTIRSLRTKGWKKSACSSEERKFAIQQSRQNEVESCGEKQGCKGLPNACEARTNTVENRLLTERSTARKGFSNYLSSEFLLLFRSFWRTKNGKRRSAGKVSDCLSRSNAEVSRITQRSRQKDADCALVSRRSLSSVVLAHCRLS